MEGYQLSPQQRHLWSLQRDGRDSPYNAQCVIRIDGHLDVDVLRRALVELSARHEILRTAYFGFDEMTLPVQVVSEQVPLVLDEHDMSTLEEGERARRIASFFEEAGRNSYDFEAPPLVQMALAVVSPAEHVLLIRSPALCMDGRGLAALVEELCQCYGAQSSDDPLQYVDASTWLNEALGSSDAELGREFWQKQNPASLINLKLPFEKRNPDATDFDPRRLAVLPIASGIDTLAHKFDVPSDVLLLTCWQFLLQRLIGDTRLLVSYGSDGRSYEELEKALGLFARFLPLGGTLSEELPFGDALDKVVGAIREALEWGECFDWRKVSSPDGREPFFPISFEYRDWPSQHRSGDVTFTTERIDACVDRFKLKLVCWKEEGGLAAALEYDGNFYGEEDMERLAAQLATLVNDVASRPDARLGELDLLTEAERRQILFDVNDTAGSTTKEACLHHLFEAQAGRTPKDIAVHCEDRYLTFEELNNRANRLARHLQELGVGPEVLVALTVERSLDAIVGILGILKAGGAYVPLDPLLPKSRLGMLLEESQAPVIVTQEQLLEKLPPHKAQVVLLNAHQDSDTTEPKDNVESEAGPENLVYVLFTSGSTGKPKGVAVEHRQLVNYVEAVRACLDLPPGASYATVSTLAADLGNTAIYPSLCSGGCLHVVVESTVSDPEAFGDYFERHRIDVLKIVPSHLEALLSGSRPERLLPRLRLILGGEPSTWDLVDKIQALAPHCVIFNHYGPTETTIGVTTRRLDVGHRPATPPIGRPITNVKIYALDTQRRPVPFWVPGELHIGGAAVARGYLNGGLTDEKFITDPFSNEAGARLYKTGDLVRFLPTGELEFLGRIDDQVKIRGYRVELGEIEEALRRQSETIRESAVMIREEASGDKRLVAYVVPTHGQVPDPDELRASLKEELPDYMVPSAIVTLEALPLTPNGKLDRKALPDPAQSSTSEKDTEKIPHTRWESVIAEVWKDYLHTEVGTHDNFYDLGGHSLLAIQVVRALEKRTGIEVSPRELIFHTLRQFAAVCESKRSTPDES